MPSSATTSTHQPPDAPSSNGSKLQGPLVTCPECSQQSPRSNRFCGGCGQSLWKKCPKCGVEQIDGETFCGGCGANLEEIHADQLQGVKATLEESRRLAARHEFGQAIRGLRRIAAMQDRRFQSLVDEANRTIEQVQGEEQEALSKTEETVERARQLLAAHAYDQSAAVLESIPEPLRKNDADGLLREAVAKRDAVTALKLDIRAAVRTSELQELSRHLEQLLDLTPDDEQATRLAHQLRDRLLQAAKKKVQEDDYPGALRLLEDVPTCALDDEVEKVANQVRELDWLMTNLRLAAVVDDTVLALADRLMRLRPQNQEAAWLRKKLKARYASRSSDKLQVAPDWAVPREPHLGFPVEWPAGWRRISCSEDVRQALAETSTSYCVACGLAMQGLGLTPITMNLLNRVKQAGVLGKLKFGRFGRPQAAWGLDLGTHALKAVRMRRSDDGNQPVVDACYRIEHEDWSKIDEDNSNRTRALAKSLEQFLAQHAIKDEKVCVSLPGSLVLGRFFDLPPIEEGRIDDAVRYEAAGQIPFALEDLHWGYQLFDLGDDESTEFQTKRVVLQAAKSHHMQDLALLCENAGFKPDIVQSDCAALHNFIAHEHLEKDTPQQGSIAVLDVGASKTNLVISSSKSVWFRSIGVAGESFTSKLVRSFRLTRDQAEALKRRPSRAKRLYPVYEALNPSLMNLVEEVQRSLKVHQRLYPHLPVQRMLGTGDGFAMHGLLRRLRTGR